MLNDCWICATRNVPYSPGPSGPEPGRVRTGRGRVDEYRTGVGERQARASSRI